jgi:hypothetical protein
LVLKTERGLAFAADPEVVDGGETVDAQARAVSVIFSNSHKYVRDLNFHKKFEKN